MPGQTLHQFDLALCRYVLGNIRSHRDRPGFAAFAQEQVEPAIWDYLQALDGEQEAPDLLLSDKELSDLGLVFMDGPTDYHPAWVPYPPLHQGSIDCLPEIRKELASECADEWARRTAHFSQQLEQDRISLSTGIQVVEEWASEVRRLLRAMGAVDLLPVPEGAFPTPTFPQPTLSRLPAASPLSFPSPSQMPHLLRGEEEKGRDSQSANETECKVASPELSRREAARYLGVSVDTLLQLQRAGLLRYRNASPPGSGKPRYRYPVADLDRFMQQGYHRDQAKPNKATRRQRTQVQPQAYEHLDLD